MMLREKTIRILKKYPFLRWVAINQIPFFGLFIWIALRTLPQYEMSADFHYWVAYFIALEVYICFFYPITKCGVFDLDLNKKYEMKRDASSTYHDIEIPTEKMMTDYMSVRRSLLQGNGVFAKCRISSQRKIAYFEGYVVEHNSYHTLFLDGEHIESTSELKYLNHSCNPNAYFCNRWLIASRDIPKGEELTINYFVTETNIGSPFICKCGAKNCRDKNKV